MKAFRSSVLIAGALAFTLSACSQPDNLKTPSLEAQFGSADDEYGADVTVSSTGQIYELSKRTGSHVVEGNELLFGTIYLTRYTSGGSVLWQKEVATEECNGSYSYCTSDFPKARAVYTDSSNHVYVWVGDSYSFYDWDEEGQTTRNYSQIYQYSTAGNLIDAYYGGSPHCVSTAGSCSIDKAMDKAGVVYTARSGFGYGGDLYEYESVVTKDYVWERSSTVGVLYGIAVANSGSITVVGDQGMARYTNSGSLVWTKTGTSYAVKPDSDIRASGSNVYVRNLKEIRKFDANGKLLWRKTQAGLNAPVLQDIAADGSGNVYLSGKYAAGTGNWNAFTRKLNASGAVLWTKTYGTPAFDDALGIATITGSEIYLTGVTFGSLSHTNIGGADGYLRKLNSLGNYVWTK